MRDRDCGAPLLSVSNRAEEYLYPGFSGSPPIPVAVVGNARNRIVGVDYVRLHDSCLCRKRRLPPCRERRGTIGILPATRIRSTVHTRVRECTRPKHLVRLFPNSGVADLASRIHCRRLACPSAIHNSFPSFVLTHSCAPAAAGNPLSLPWSTWTCHRLPGLGPLERKGNVASGRWRKRVSRFPSRPWRREGNPRDIGLLSGDDGPDRPGGQVTSPHGRPRRFRMKNSASADVVLSGSSSGRKCPHGKARPSTRSA